MITLICKGEKTLIRKLTADDQQDVNALLTEKMEVNFFIIARIETYGYDDDFQEAWGAFNKNNQLIGLMLRTAKRYTVYANDVFPAREFAEIVNHDPQANMLFGLKEQVEHMAPFLNQTFQSQEKLYYAICRTQTVKTEDKVDQVREIKQSEVGQLINFFQQITEFNDTHTDLAAKQRDMRNGHSRSYVFEKNNKLISTASTSFETNDSAMITAVATHPQHTRKGYATTCLSQLLTDVLADEKVPYLLYDNRLAGGVYQALGFELVGDWVLYRRQAK